MVGSTMFFYLFLSLSLLSLCHIFEFNASLIQIFHLLPLLPLSRYPLSREDSYLNGIPRIFYVILIALGALPQVAAFTFYFTADPQLFMLIIAPGYAVCSLLLFCYDPSDCFFLKPVRTLTHAPSLSLARRMDRYLASFFGIVSVTALLSGLFLIPSYGCALMLCLSLVPFFCMPLLWSQAELQHITRFQLFILLSYAFFDLSLPDQSVVVSMNLSDWFFTTKLVIVNKPFFCYHLGIHGPDL